jgi:hypothetical protein
MQIYAESPRGSILQISFHSCKHMPSVWLIRVWLTRGGRWILMLDYCHIFSSSFSSPSATRTNHGSIERDLEYHMPNLTFRIPAMSPSDWQVLRTYSGARQRHCREAATELNTPASTRRLLPNFHPTLNLCQFDCL